MIDFLSTALLKPLVILSSGFKKIKTGRIATITPPCPLPTTSGSSCPKKEGKLQEVVQEYLRLNFPNHQLDEIIYHAEAHVPKILYEPKRGGAHTQNLKDDLVERHPISTLA